MKIYTKTGDKGLTSLFDGTRVKKSNLRVDTYGTIDELNSVIGVIIAKLGKEKYEERLKEKLLGIQDDLLNIGSILANPSLVEKHIDEEKKHFSEVVDLFEKYIDKMTKELPELTQFIYPGGGEIGAFLHLARVVTRKVERKIVALMEKESIAQEIQVYFNRLSDLLFTMSRYANFKQNKKENIWVKRS